MAYVRSRGGEGDRFLLDLIADSGIYRHRSLRDRLTTGFGIRPKSGDWEVLYVLIGRFLQHREISATEIPLSAGLSEATARRHLRALELIGVVESRIDDHDHRRRIVELTPPVREEVRQFVASYEEAFRHLVDAHDRGLRKAAISEANTTREALLEHRVYLQQIQEIANIGFWAWDYRVHRYLFGQRARLHGFGIAMADYSDDDPDRYYDDHLLIPEDRVRYRKLVDDAVATGSPTDFVFRIARKDGSIRHIQEVSIPVFDMHGELERAVGVMWDVTERVGREQAAETLRRQLEGMYERSSEPAFVLDAKSERLTFVNAAFCRLFGKTRQCVMGRQLHDFLSVREQRSLRLTLSQLCSDQPSFTFATALPGCAGGAGTVDWTALGIFSGEERLDELHVTGTSGVSGAT